MNMYTVLNMYNSTLLIQPMENCMGLITCYIEIARGKVK